MNRQPMVMAGGDLFIPNTQWKLNLEGKSGLKQWRGRGTKSGGRGSARVQPKPAQGSSVDYSEAKALIEILMTPSRLVKCNYRKRETIESGFNIWLVVISGHRLPGFEAAFA